VQFDYADGSNVITIPSYPDATIYS
jgi:hypothetical protein